MGMCPVLKESVKAIDIFIRQILIFNANLRLLDMNTKCALSLSSKIPMKMD